MNFSQPDSLYQQQSMSQLRTQMSSSNDRIDGSILIPIKHDLSTTSTRSAATSDAAPRITKEAMSTFSSTADEKQIDVLVASPITMATEASAIVPTIETTFMLSAAVPAIHGNPSKRLDEQMGESPASLSLFDLGVAEIDTANNDGHRFGATSTLQAQPVLTSTNRNLPQRSNFLRTKEPLCYALAGANLEHDKDVTDDDDDYMCRLKEGLEFITRPRMSEKHLFALAGYLLDDSDDDDDDDDDEYM